MDNNSNRELIIQQWQTCVEMANNLSTRRDSMNNIFIVLNTAIVTAISFTRDIKSILLTVCGIILGIVWLIYINNFKRLSAEKYHIINDMEKALPIQPFTKEWNNLNKRKYLKQTTIERIIPITFILIYVVFSIFIFYNR